MSAGVKPAVMRRRCAGRQCLYITPARLTHGRQETLLRLTRSRSCPVKHTESLGSFMGEHGDLRPDRSSAHPQPVIITGKHFDIIFPVLKKKKKNKCLFPQTRLKGVGQ